MRTSPSPATTADGTLDATFSGDGLRNSGFGGGDDERAQAVVIQTDGKIVVAGFSNARGDHDFAVARYNADGSLDTSFGYDGTLLAWFASGKEDRAYDLALQTDGKMVLVGSTGSDVDRRFRRRCGDNQRRPRYLVRRRWVPGRSIWAAPSTSPGPWPSSLTARLSSSGETNRSFGSSDVDFALVRVQCRRNPGYELRNRAASSAPISGTSPTGPTM